MKVIIYAVSLVAAVVLMTVVRTPLAHAFPAPQEDPVFAPVERDPPVFRPAGDGFLDTDSDGVVDKNTDGVRIDNCPAVPNGYCDVEDEDNDCDIDGDGEVTASELAAGNQRDWNRDGTGDACDDTDEDEVTDYLDNCPAVFNPMDENGIQDANACSNVDGDGFSDNVDNCPNLYNPRQKDEDEDGIGDWCDNCRFVANPDQADADDDGFGDVCMRDADGDGIPDSVDNCLTVPNPDQANEDGDFRGDACDVLVQSAEPTENPHELAWFSNDGCTLVAGGQVSAGAIIYALFCLASVLAARGLRRKLRNSA